MEKKERDNREEKYIKTRHGRNSRHEETRKTNKE
jgi:hypothetical protein